MNGGAVTITAPEGLLAGEPDEFELDEGQLAEVEEPVCREQAWCLARFLEALSRAPAPPHWVGVFDRIYYCRRRPRVYVSPDISVFLGEWLPPGPPLKVWSEDFRPPGVIIELVSSSTVDPDMGPKSTLYEQLRVQEYFQFDATFEVSGKRVLPVPLQGFRLGTDGTFHPILPEGGRWPSVLLGVELVPAPPLLRLWDRVRGSLVPLDPELREAAERHAEEAKRQAEEAQRRAVEAEERAVAAERERAELRRRLG